MSEKKEASDLKEQTSTYTKRFTVRNFEVEMAEVGLLPWDVPKEVTVSKLDLNLADNKPDFDTGATHNVLTHVIILLTCKK